MSLAFGWVTAREARGLDEDEPVLVAALRARGARVEVVDWHDPTVSWAEFDRVLLRSAWDYPQHPAQFDEWLRHVSSLTALVNHESVVRWNLDKCYLFELADAGLPIIATKVAAPGAPIELFPGPVVVKPAVGAGSRDAAWYGSDQSHEAHAHIERLHQRGETVLVQPYLESIARDGEWSMVFFGQQFSHAAHRQVALSQAKVANSGFGTEVNAAHDASSEQIDVAAAAIDYVSRRFGALTYARVDLVRDENGEWVILELELIEPSLFMAYTDASAVERFVTAVSDSVAPTANRPMQGHER